MPLRVLLKLPIKEQIARQRHAHIAADKIRIEFEQRMRIRKLRKGAVLGVIRGVGAGPDTKQIQIERRFWIAILSD
jgi:hypothetical protein